MTRSRTFLASAVLAVLAVCGALPFSGASFTSDATVSGNTVTTAALPATAPVVGAVTAGSVDLSWRAAPAGGAAPRYTLTRHAGGTATDVYTGDATTFTDVGNLPAETSTFAYRAVAAGYDHSLAVDSGGAVWAWGANDLGQLGTGSAGASSATPRRVVLPGGVAITAVAAGWSHSLAVDSAGDVWSWGRNGDGQLGTGASAGFSATAFRVAMPEGVRVTAVAAGSDHSLALDSTGGVWAWGANSSGQAGSIAGRVIRNPVRVSLPRGAIVTEVGAGSVQSFALDSTGRVWAWGNNSFGQLGTGTTGGETPIPAAVRISSAVTTLVTGQAHSLALDSTGVVWAWGNNDVGQLGLGGYGGTSGTPVRVTLPAIAVPVAAGGQHSYARDADGTLWAWGGNIAGQLGDGSASTGKIIPTRVSVPRGVAVTAGYFHTFALDSNGALSAWGWNGLLQLGTGSTAEFVGTPARVPAVTRATCPVGSSLVGDGSTCSLTAGTDYTYTVTTTIGGWSVASIPVTVRTATS